MLAAGCILYCQESVYRLNAVICTVFIILALHQFITPIIMAKSPEDESTEKLSEKIEKLEEEIKKSTTVETNTQ